MEPHQEIPVERRRRNRLQDVLGLSSRGAMPLRRESDRVRARLQHWVDLADRALGIRSRTLDQSELSTPSDSQDPDLQNKEY